jgi:tRNA isopentenyl-2-thiomethyl-A-37 hydroxylase MiaE
MATRSTEWWARIRNDATRLTAWLYDQYRGEVTAAARIEALRDRFAERGSRAYRVLTVIARQEREHASWVGELLAARGLRVEVQAKADRYWRAVVPGIEDLATGAAVGAHAETMRLERIEAIAADPTAPADIRAVFAKILPQERFHAKAFTSLATPEAMARTANAHALGRIALGLSA